MYLDSCWKESGFPDSSVDKEFSCNVGDLGSIPGLGRSPEKESLPSPVFWSGEFHGLYGVTKTLLSDFHFHLLAWLLSSFWFLFLFLFSLYSTLFISMWVSLGVLGCWMLISASVLRFCILCCDLWSLGATVSLNLWGGRPEARTLAHQRTPDAMEH